MANIPSSGNPKDEIRSQLAPGASDATLERLIRNSGGIYRLTGAQYAAIQFKNPDHIYIVDGVLQVNQGPQPLTISGTPDPVVKGQAYGPFTGTTTGGSGTKRYSLRGSLPQGMTFDPALGIGGTPTSGASTRDVYLTVTDDTGSATLGPLFFGPAAVVSGGVAASAILISTTGVGSDGARHSTGQVYTASVIPSGAPIQWQRVALASPYTATDISGATSLNYTAQAADIGFDIGVRGQSGSAFARVRGKVFTPATLIESFDATTGFATGTGFARNTITDERKAQGTGALQLRRNVTQASDVITTKSISGGVDTGAMDIMVASVWHTNNFSDSQHVVGIQEGDGTLITASNITAIADDDNISTRTQLMVDTADIANKVGANTAASVYIRSYGRPSNMTEPVFDALYMNARGAPTVVPYADDALRSWLTTGVAQYWADRQVYQAFVIPTDSLQETINSSGFFAKADIATLMNMGHRVIPNFSPDDKGPDQVAVYPTLQSYIDRVLQGTAILRGLGVPEEWLKHGVFSNGIFNRQYPRQKVADAVYDGAGGVTLTATPTVAPVVGMAYRGWDVTTGLFVTTTISEVTSATVFKTSYIFPVNSTTNSKYANYYDTTGEMYARKVVDRLKLEGFKTGRATVWKDPRSTSRFGIADPLCLPSQSFTGLAAAQIIAGTTTVAQKYGCTVPWYTHGAVTPPDPQSIGHFVDDLKLVADNYAAQQQAGNLFVLAPDQWYARDGVTGAQ